MNEFDPQPPTEPAQGRGYQGQAGPWGPGAQAGHAGYQPHQPWLGGQPGWPPVDSGPWHNPQRPTNRGRTIGFALCAIGLSMLVGLGVGRILWPTSASTQGVVTSGTNTSINPSAIAAKADPGLVDINTVLGYRGAEAAGTGIVLSSGGEILTNNHVVEGATSIKVTDIGNGRTYSASVVGYDRTQDVAVLQLQGASGLTTEALGDSTKVSVGDAIVGIGNAGGAGGTPSAASGTVTALSQSITASDESSGAAEQLTGLIQVNANIQSGDSGGALVNSAGQVIGMDTAASAGYQLGTGPRGYNQHGHGTGDDQSSTDHQGYAIPINQAASIANQIVAGTGSNTVHIGSTALLGVSVSSAGQGESSTGGFDQPAGPSAGAQVQGLLATGPAAKAGLARGDVITAVNGQTVDSATTLTNLMDTHHPGDSLTITWIDTTGQQHVATVVPITGPVG